MWSANIQVLVTEGRLKTSISILLARNGLLDTILSPKKSHTFLGCLKLHTDSASELRVSLLIFVCAEDKHDIPMYHTFGYKVGRFSNI